LKQITLQNPFITLIVLNYGAIIQKLMVKDKDGKLTNVVVGLEFPSDYQYDNKYLGACTGRYAGRISKGGFELDRASYPLFHKNGVHLHGGKRGFGKKIWTIETIDHGEEPFVKLSYLSEHLEEGYPGNLKATVTYKLMNNELHIIHEATTDRSTVVNLTNHSYFCLDDAPTIDNHLLQLNCSQYVETDDDLLPTGRVSSVTASSYDFLEEKQIGTTRLDTPMVNNSISEVVAALSSEKSGISMKVTTNQPAVVVYTPTDFPAICFETQNYPDAPNQKNFPNSVLRPGEVYKNHSKFVFDLI
jgi:aldose 1-epimerase